MTRVNLRHRSLPLLCRLHTTTSIPLLLPSLFRVFPSALRSRRHTTPTAGREKRDQDQAVTRLLNSRSSVLSTAAPARKSSLSSAISTSISATTAGPWTAHSRSLDAKSVSRRTKAYIATSGSTTGRMLCNTAFPVWKRDVRCVVRRQEATISSGICERTNKTRLWMSRRAARSFFPKDFFALCNYVVCQVCSQRIL